MEIICKMNISEPVKNPARVNVKKNQSCRITDQMRLCDFICHGDYIQSFQLELVTNLTICFTPCKNQSMYCYVHLQWQLSYVDSNLYKSKKKISFHVKVKEAEQVNYLCVSFNTCCESLFTGTSICFVILLSFIEDITHRSKLYLP